MDSNYVFGPVPSRRLGKSVGINNIPPKTCTYSCVYCQLGVTRKMMIYRSLFHDPEKLVKETEAKIINAQSNNEPIDYLTIVSDGEPTLDSKLGKLIEKLRPLGIKIAVITNSTLLHRPDVREDLCRADWVSVKVDTLDRKTWRKIDRPHGSIDFDAMLDGICSFSNEFSRQLVTETMLVRNLNDDPENIGKTAAFIQNLDCTTAYLSIPTRPPAQKWVMAPLEQTLNTAYHTFQARGINTEYLIGYEGNQFAFTGDVEADILSITSVHPMREDAVSAYLKKSGGDFSVIEKLLDNHKLHAAEYQNQRFYIRTPANV